MSEDTMCAPNRRTIWIRGGKPIPPKARRNAPPHAPDIRIWWGVAHPPVEERFNPSRRNIGMRLRHVYNGGLIMSNFIQSTKDELFNKYPGAPTDWPQRNKITLVEGDIPFKICGPYGNAAQLDVRASGISLIRIAEQHSYWREIPQDNGRSFRGGYAGHNCSLYQIAETGEIVALCFNWNFACDAGKRGREAINKMAEQLPELLPGKY